MLSKVRCFKDASLAEGEQGSLRMALDEAWQAQKLAKSPAEWTHGVLVTLFTKRANGASSVDRVCLQVWKRGHSSRVVQEVGWADFAPASIAVYPLPKRVRRTWPAWKDIDNDLEKGKIGRRVAIKLSTYLAAICVVGSSKRHLDRMLKHFSWPEASWQAQGGSTGSDGERTGGQLAYFVLAKCLKAAHKARCDGQF